MSLSGWKQPMARHSGMLVIGAFALLVVLHKGFAGVTVKVGS
jgi:hypothetical protein